MTFVTVSLFKIVEITFNDLINKKWQNKIITDNNGNKINLNKSNLTLGQMNQLFEQYLQNNIDYEIKLCLDNKKEYISNVAILLNRWINKSRNGFLHKDIIEISNNIFEKSIKDSIIIFCLLILILF